MTSERMDLFFTFPLYLLPSQLLALNPLLTRKMAANITGISFLTAKTGTIIRPICGG
jgi:hypothetical protein